MTPYFQDQGVTLFNGDVRDVLRQLPDGAFNTCVTSPPYFGLRDYGTAQWEGGDEGCDHLSPAAHGYAPYETSTLGPKRDGVSPTNSAHSDSVKRQQYRDACGKCGALRIDRQLGLESTPEEYVANMVGVFREVRRCLRDDGTLWLNVGDSYNAYNGNRGPAAGVNKNYHDELPSLPAGHGLTVKDLKPKDLIGIPWMLAFALRQPYYAGKIRDERDRLWLAAMIDTEGSICIDLGRAGEHRPNDSYGISVRVHNTSERLIKKCADVAGVGNIKLQDTRRQHVFVWAVYGDNARSILREIYPYLVAKQHQARIGFGKVDSEGYAALKLLHAGRETTTDVPPPPSMHEPGWYLRSDIIWHKPNPMPESVTDRPTKSHEYIFLLSKSARYYYDYESIRDPAAESSITRWQQDVDNQLGSDRANGGGKANGTMKAVGGPRRSDKQRGHSRRHAGFNDRWDGMTKEEQGEMGRNKRTVWTVAPAQTKDAHFATFPEDLIRPCILAGAPDGGAVLEPFCGSGTTLKVARDLGRRATGIELNPAYCGLTVKRLAQGILFPAEGVPA